MQIFSNVVRGLAGALELHEERHRVISENLANVETPGYRARDVAFHDALENAFAGEGAAAAVRRTRAPIRLIGIAQPSDLDRDARNRAKRAEIAAVARRLIAQHDLGMRVVGGDYVDRSAEFDQLAVVYFEAPGRVDFRALIPDLARALKARIDLRQVGSRDAAAILGGVTAVFEMPNTAPPTTTRAAIEDKLARAKGRMHCALSLIHI